MSKYIEADALKKELRSWAVNLKNPRVLVKSDAEYIIDSASGIDIVRCKECKWDKAQMIPKSVKCIYQHKADDYCSYGEREGE